MTTFVLLVLAAMITANFAGVFELPSINTGSGAKKGAGGAFATGQQLCKVDGWEQRGR